MSGHLFIVTAPSGAGKTSLVSRLLSDTPGIKLSVSHTTRTRREGEIDGVHYHFVDTATFDALRAQDAFLESADVFGNRYGTSHAAVATVTEAGDDVVLEIDCQGAAQVRARHPSATSVFILPPSRATLLARLTGRASDSSEAIARRTQDAIAEMRQHGDADYLIINDDFDTAFTELQAIVLAERCRHSRQATRHAALIADLVQGDV
ncbi:MAG: guanylate kinase [Pseudomonadota bacterium]